MSRRGTAIVDCDKSEGSQTGRAITRVCVHGLGFVGLPTASILATSGFDVYGFDTSSAKREAIRAAELDGSEPELTDLIGEALDSGNLTVVDAPRAADYHLICVPTPLSDENEPDLSLVESAPNSIADLVGDGDTVVLESTVPPLTTREVLSPILERSVPDDATVNIAFCPETTLPGNTVAELRNNDRIVGGITERVIRKAVDLYDSFCRGEIYTTDATTAEFVKLVQNSFRDANIAFANETAKLARSYGISSREAIRMANTHPRVDILNPGPGVGGHCLPVDPWFLIDGSDATDLLRTARGVRDGMATYVAEMMREKLGTLNGARVAILGIAYRGGVGDTRESPGARLGDELVRLALKSESTLDVWYHDHIVQADETHNVEDLESALDGAQVCVLDTDHADYRDLYLERVILLMGSKRLVGTRNLLDHEEWRSRGFSVDVV